ncbi:MAG: 2-C-methyl-D-erythritol 4-phosphate cytidylyltransferase [Candidatus Omnitrophota bacterium]|nr:2-C-methyl-D-erythritol 4-phosphate cytidylyltransferase [Candidatus Omnitrophota bacterium]
MNLASSKRVAAIVAAAGKGERLKSKVRKPFVLLGKEPILVWALKALEACAQIGEIILVVNQADMAKARSAVNRAKLKKVVKIVVGGKRRLDSVRNGLSEVNAEAKYVLIHDGCRPFVDKKIISSVIEEMEIFGAAIPCIAVKPTIKEVEKGNFVAATLNRQSLAEAQTPQGFKKEILIRAYEKALAEGIDATDDSALVERLGIKVKVVEGSYKNIKITTPEDLKYAKMLTE